METPFWFVKRKRVGIYIPFIKWAVIFLLLHNLLYDIGIYNDSFSFNGIISEKYSCSDIMTRLIHIVTKLTDYEQLLGGYWFLNTLFWSTFIFFFTYSLLNNKCFSIVLLLFSTITLYYFNIHIPYFNIGGREFLAALILFIGYVCKNHLNFTRYNYLYIIAGFILVLLGSVFGKTNKVSMKWYYVIPYLICSFGAQSLYSLR